MKAREVLEKHIVWAWEPKKKEEDTYRRIREDLVSKGIRPSTFEDAVTDSVRQALAQSMAVVEHRSLNADKKSPWAKLSPKAQRILRKQYDLDDHAFPLVLVGDKPVDLSRFAAYLAATYARTTQRVVMRETPASMVEAIRDVTSYGTDEWVDRVKRAGMLLVECASGEFFGMPSVAGSISNIFHDRMLSGRATVFAVSVYGSTYAEAFDSGDVSVMARMVEQGCARTTPIIPYIVSNNAYWLFLG